MKKRFDFLKFRKKLMKVQTIILKFLGILFFWKLLGLTAVITLYVVNYVLFCIEDKVRTKNEKSLSEEEKFSNAYHEAGHVVMFKFFNWKVREATITPSQNNDGHVIADDYTRKYTTKKKLEEEIMIFLGGRVAESLVLDDIDNGSNGDLNQATSIALKMITEYGMDSEIGPISISKNPKEDFPPLSEEMNNKIWDKTLENLKELEKKTKRILVANRDFLDIIAHNLLEYNTISGEKIENLYQQYLSEHEKPENVKI